VADSFESFPSPPVTAHGILARPRSPTNANHEAGACASGGVLHTVLAVEGHTNSGGAMQLPDDELHDRAATIITSWWRGAATRQNFGPLLLSVIQSFRRNNGWGYRSTGAILSYWHRRCPLPAVSPMIASPSSMAWLGQVEDEGDPPATLNESPKRLRRRRRYRSKYRTYPSLWSGSYRRRLSLHPTHPNNLHLNARRGVG
jgi:hypothetical protein